MDEELALAGEITESLRGAAIALPKGEKIVIDSITGPPPDVRLVEAAVEDFVRRRRDAADYSVEMRGDTIVVHSPDPIAASHRARPERLPPNLFKCPFCPFVTPYEELYVVHYRSHGYVL
jgi:hypothetical protein